MLEIPIQNFMGRSYSDTFVGGRYHINLQEDAVSLFRMWQSNRVVTDDYFRDFILDEDMKRLDI